MWMVELPARSSTMSGYSDDRVGRPFDAFTSFDERMVHCSARALNRALAIAGPLGLSAARPRKAHNRRTPHAPIALATSRTTSERRLGLARSTKAHFSQKAYDG